MSGDVVLTAALRNNLLSLQNTQRSIDTTQLRLATGLKVNSALDNPQNFFAAQALNNRAGDLTRLLDGIAQSVRAIEEADNGVTALTNLVEQAESVAISAQDQLAAAEATTVAETMSSLNLAEIDNLGDLDAITTGGAFTLTITVGTGTDNTNNQVIATGMQSIGALVANIDNIDDVNAELTDDGQLRITTTSGEAIRIQSGTATLTDADNLGLANVTGTGNITFSPGNGLRASLQDTNGDIAARTANFTALNGFTGATGSFSLTVTTVGGGTATVAVAAGTSISNLVDQINTNLSAGANQFGVSASYDDSTGELEIEFDNEIASAVNVTGFGTASDFGFGTNGGIDAGATEQIQVSTGAVDDTLSSLEADFNEIRSQIDSIVEDANYRGTNLLKGDDLLTTFNEDRSNTLSTSGVTFTSAGLEIDSANFSSDTTVSTSLSQIRAALSEVRNFGTTLANDLSIIQTRQDFTEKTINTLEAGADDLTVADQNEEGANLLALQTRQQLGVTSLALASQSQQSVLRLF